MRKILSFITVLFVLSGLTFAGVMTVTSPAGGSSWCIGQPLNILWNETPKDHTDVKIRLYDTTGNVKIFDITNSTTNDGAFDWTIPSSIAPGQYTVRVKTLDNQESDDTPVFTINNCTPTGSISVAKPANVLLGNDCPISWTSTGTVGSAVNIMLFNQAGTAQVYLIAHNTNNDNSHTWPVPASIQAGNYRIKVENSNGTISGISDVFNIGTTITFRPREGKVYIMPKPDLKITIIPVTAPEAEVNKNMLMEFKVDNIGKATSKETTLRVFLGSSQSDTWVIKPIEPGRFRYKTKNFTPTSAGGYIAWSADVDHANNIGDSTRPNNYAKYNMTVKGPDLKFTRIHSPDYRQSVQQKCKMFVTITNVGTVKAGRFEVDCDMHIKSGLAQGRKYKVCNGLMPGKSVTYEFDGRYAGIGMKYPDLYIDKANAVMEENENNNHCSFVFHISVGNIFEGKRPRTSDGCD